jgi:uncharacterized protein (TIGR02679 family)
VIDEARLRDVLGAAGLARLVSRLRTRLERGRPLAGTLVLPGASEGEREAVGRLLGRAASRGASVSVSLVEVEALLRAAGICERLSEAVAVLTGPVANRRDEERSLEAQWTSVFEEAGRDLDSRAAVRGWLEEVRATGIVRRLAAQDPDRGRALLVAAREVARRLPASGMPLAELAALCAGDGHALDMGEPLGTICLRLALALGGATADPAQGRRDAWASVGILCDELSAPVLLLNVRGAGAGPADTALRVHADAGEPYRLSVRQLLRGPPRLDPGTCRARTVFVCENPTVLAAAANRLGARAAPLVCVEGQPRTAARLLLQALRGAGLDLAYHGDFDWGGLRIGNVVVGRLGARPWRFGADDYLSAPGGARLGGAQVAACWDGRLGDAMARRGAAVHEEAVIDALLADLADAAEAGS